MNKFMIILSLLRRVIRVFRTIKRLRMKQGKNESSDVSHSDVNYQLDGLESNPDSKEALMSEKTKKILRASSTVITVVGVCGLGITGATDADVSNIVRVGTMIASVIGSLITLAIPRKD